MLRWTAAADLLWCGYMFFVISTSKYILTALLALAIISAIFLLIGHRSRLAALTTALTEFVIITATLSLSGPYMTCVRLASSFTLIIAIALFGLGPGLLSVDAHRYGRREIIISRHN